MKRASVCAVLNVYRRSHHLSKQLERLTSQTIAINEFIVYQNSVEDLGAREQSDLNKRVRDICETSIPGNFTIVKSSRNLGIWARFSIALNATSEFICVFDDDSFPGSRWLENCFRTYDNQPGLLGSRGLRYLKRERAWPYDEYGWARPNSDTVEVDIVGHSWFFRREWLGAYWGALPQAFLYPRAGEDLHFSYVMQRFLNLKTFVPPHPVDEPELFGNDPRWGRFVGFEEGLGISNSFGAQRYFDRALKHYVKLGYSLYIDRVPDMEKTSSLGDNSPRNIIGLRNSYLVVFFRSWISKQPAFSGTTYFVKRLLLNLRK